MTFDESIKTGVPVINFIGNTDRISSAPAFAENVHAAVTAMVWTSSGCRDRNAIPLMNEIKCRVGVRIEIVNVGEKGHLHIQQIFEDCRQLLFG